MKDINFQLSKFFFNLIFKCHVEKLNGRLLSLRTKKNKIKKLNIKKFREKNILKNQRLRQNFSQIRQG